MYKILGSDQKEYGPVSSDVVRQWIADRRANGQTMVQAEGSADWKPLSQCAEFNDALGAASAPPALPGQAPTPEARPLPKTSGMAIASLILGGLGVITCGLTSLVGLVLGIVSLSKINKSAGRLSGKGLSIAGICVSGFFLLLLPLYLAVGFPALAKARSSALSVSCLNNLRQLSLALNMYASANDDTLPPAATWCDAIAGGVGDQKAFRCPRAHQERKSSYGLNQQVAGKRLSDMNPATVMLFEIDGGWNVSGGPASVVSRPRHQSAYNVSFADGSVRQVPAADVPGLRWEP